MEMLLHFPPVEFFTSVEFCRFAQLYWPHRKFAAANFPPPLSHQDVSSMQRYWIYATLAFFISFITPLAQAEELVIADEGKSAASVVVSAEAGEWEKRAADDLSRYIELLSGAKVPVANKPGEGINLFVGQAAIAADPSLKAALAKVTKPQPVLRADAIVLRRAGQRVFLAGTNDESHYYAVSELLKRWGCRWYLPTEFGECIPEQPHLAINELEYAYAPPFEIRKYWISWVGDTSGQAEFMQRNYFNNESVPNGHALAQFVSELIPAGKTMFNVPIAEEATADHVAAKLSERFAKGERIMLGMEDGIYDSDSPRDKELIAGLKDKYFLSESLTDPFFEFYNGVAKRLLKQHPNSQAKIGFLAYANITIPPQRKIVAEKPLVAYLAPIDIDPIHGMDDPRSPPKQELKEMLKRWAEVMQGRLVIYDYDQSMLVWRDIPNPSHLAFQQDVKQYRDAKILGVDTESRNAIATTFLNLYFRGQLCWNPDFDVDAELSAFYPAFYGPTAAPMEAYWTAIYDAWQRTLVSEHEYPVIPAIYTPQLLKTLRGHLETAEKMIAPLAAKANASRNEKLFVDRIKFTRLSFNVLENYVAMQHAAATEIDYSQAVAAGERALAAREQLTAMNGTFTTYKTIGEHGPAWFPGEVQQYRDLLQLTNGTKGTLLLKTPLEWAFRRDPHDSGVAGNWAAKTPDLTWWKSQKDAGTFESHQHNPGHWELMRTDLYLQAQGLITPDFHSYTGHGWYNTTVTLNENQLAGNVHLMFPGLFNECWLYVNGHLVQHRPQKDVWWYNDYKFEWDVDIRSALKPGENTIVLRYSNPHHFGGMFRRPFLYQAK